MEQLNIKVEPEIHYNDPPHAPNMQQTDTFASSHHDSSSTNLLNNKLTLKPDPDESSKLIHNTQSTLQSSDGVTMHIKEEPAADVGYDEPTPLSDNLLMARLHLIGPCAGYVRLANIMWSTNPAAKQEYSHCCIPVCWQTESGLNLLQASLKVEDIGESLEESSLESVHEQEVAIEDRTDDVCKTNNIDCTTKVDASGNTYECDVCHKCFSGRNKIRMHFRTHKDRSYKCNTCDKSFKLSRDLNLHTRTHSEQSPYKCDICDKVFTLPNNLKRHLSIHTEVKQFECDICKKSFRRSSYLKLHKLTHTGKKPYKCNLCSMAYGSPNNLRTHIRTHTGVRPYKCDKCSKAFNNPGNLRTHLRTHTGDKPYKCDVCNITFGHSSNLTVHMRNHTGERPYKCDKCDRAYSQLNAVKYHISRKH